MALLEVKNFNVTYKLKDKEVYAVQDAFLESGRAGCHWYCR